MKEDFKKEAVLELLGLKMYSSSRSYNQNIILDLIYYFSDKKNTIDIDPYGVKLRLLYDIYLSDDEEYIKEIIKDYKMKVKEIK